MFLYIPDALTVLVHIYLYFRVSCLSLTYLLFLIFPKFVFLKTVIIHVFCRSPGLCFLMSLSGYVYIIGVAVNECRASFFHIFYCTTLLCPYSLPKPTTACGLLCAAAPASSCRPWCVRGSGTHVGASAPGAWHRPWLAAVHTGSGWQSL